jgi:hypothetical protein
VRIVRQDASETLRRYSLSGWIAIKECSKRNRFSACVVAACSNEKERTYTQTTGFGPVPHLVRLSGGAACCVQAACARSHTWTENLPRLRPLKRGNSSGSCYASPNRVGTIRQTLYRRIEVTAKTTSLGPLHSCLLRR